MDNLDKIKDRIAKLLAMAEDASSPEEAAIAAKRARALMDKHQISETDITQVKAESFGALAAGQAYKYMPTWKNILGVAVARYNDCQAHKVSVGGSKLKMHFLGFAEDVAMAVIMYDHLCRAVENWCKIYMNSIGHGSYYMASIGNPYKHGMAQRVCTKLEELTVERDQITMEGDDASKGAGRSLVVVKTDIIEKVFGKAEYETVKPRVTNEAAERARVQGWIDGEAVSVNDQIEE